MKKSKKQKLEKSGYSVKEAADFLGLSNEEISLLEKQKKPSRAAKPKGSQSRE